MRLRYSNLGLVLPLVIALTIGTRISPQQSSSNDTQQSGLVLGVLEDLPGHYSGEPNFRAIRVLFQKVGEGWRVFPTEAKDQQSLKSLTKSYPGEINWTIAFDGKDLGHLTSRVPDDFAWYSEVGLEKITSPGQVPTVGKQSVKYSGWSDVPVYRPLVAVSNPNFRDPQGWEPAHLSPQQVAKIRTSFRNKFPKVSNCKNPDENVARPWKYQDDDIQVNTAYASEDHWLLVELSLQNYACDGPVEDGGPFVPQWYVVEPTGMVSFLNSNMWLVDAGDYDGDGKSEVLFAISGYDEGGYRLFYSDFGRSAEFLFGYH